MPTRRSRSKTDANTTAMGLVAAVTGTGAVNGEELMASPEARRLYREAKARLSAKPARKQPVK